MGENERENRALEATIVHELQRERDPMNPDDLPELTDSQRAAMNRLPANLVEQLWDEVDEEELERPIAAALRHMGWLLPRTVEEVRQAEAYLEAHPVELPESLRDPMAILKQMEGEET